jgi:hypothetical protein
MTIMNNRKNFRMLSRLLGGGGILLCLAGASMKKEPEKDIVLYVALSIAIALLILIILYTIKPGSFKNKSPNPDEYPD